MNAAIHLNVSETVKAKLLQSSRSINSFHQSHPITTSVTPSQSHRVTPSPFHPVTAHRLPRVPRVPRVPLSTQAAPTAPIAPIALALSPTRQQLSSVALVALITFHCGTSSKAFL